MKKYSACFFLFLLVSVLSFIETPLLMAGNVSGNKTILDYYLMIPDSYFQCETEDLLRQKDKLELIRKKNLAKGYIRASTKDGNIPVEAALFKDDYLGIKVVAVNVTCPSGCMCRKLDFFFVSNGNLMKNEESSIFPKTEDIEKAAGVTAGYLFFISEDGKGINVTEAGSGRLLLKIEWSGGTFNIK